MRVLGLSLEHLLDAVNLVGQLPAGRLVLHTTHVLVGSKQTEFQLVLALNERVGGLEALQVNVKSKSSLMK